MNCVLGIREWGRTRARFPLPRVQGSLEIYPECEKKGVPTATI